MGELFMDGALAEHFSPSSLLQSSLLTHKTFLCACQLDALGWSGLNLITLSCELIDLSSKVSIGPAYLQFLSVSVFFTVREVKIGLQDGDSMEMCHLHSNHRTYKILFHDICIFEFKVRKSFTYHDKLVTDIAAISGGVLWHSLLLVSKQGMSRSRRQDRQEFQLCYHNDAQTTYLLTLWGKLERKGRKQYLQYLVQMLRHS